MSYRYVYRSSGGIPTATSKSARPERVLNIVTGAAKANSLKSPSVTMAAEGYWVRMSAMKDCLGAGVSGFSSFLDR